MIKFNDFTAMKTEVIRKLNEMAVVQSQSLKESVAKDFAKLDESLSKDEITRLYKLGDSMKDSDMNSFTGDIAIKDKIAKKILAIKDDRKAMQALAAEIVKMKPGFKKSLSDKDLKKFNITESKSVENDLSNLKIAADYVKQNGIPSLGEVNDFKTRFQVSLGQVMRYMTNPVLDDENSDKDTTQL